MSIKRKLKRQKKKDAEKEMKQALGLFDKIPEDCLTCKTKFDKKDKRMVSEWQVVVRKEEKVVRLYCPECWDTAIKIVKEYHDETAGEQ